MGRMSSQLLRTSNLCRAVTMRSCFLAPTVTPRRAPKGTRNRSSRRALSLRRPARASRRFQGRGRRRVRARLWRRRRALRRRCAQREHERQLRLRRRQGVVRVAAAEALDHLAARDDVPRAVGKLVQPVDAQPGAEQRPDDVGDRVLPLVRAELVLGRRIGVVDARRPADPRGIVEVRKDGAEAPGLGHVLVEREHARRRVRLDDVEEPARREVVGDERPPTARAPAAS